VELAQISGLARMSIIYVETAHHDSVKTATLEKLADAFGVTASDLMPPHRPTKARRRSA
jgi:hypothetical protein